MQSHGEAVEEKVAAGRLPRQAVDIAALACRPHLQPQAGTPMGCSLDRKMVWAHYVTWHNAFNNYQLCQSYHEFSLQHDATLVDSCRREIALAQACGIDGFLIDSGGETGIWETSALFKAVEGTSFLLAICQDFPGGKGEDAYMDFSVNMVEKYAKTIGMHPNYARIDGKMILASFSATRVSAEVIRKIRKRLHDKGIDIFYIFDLDNNQFYTHLDQQGDYRQQGDIFYSFVPSHRGWNPNGEPLAAFRDTFEKLSTWAAVDGKKYMLSVHPGYIGRWMQGQGAQIPFRGYDKLWDCFHAAAPSEISWVHVTSWNDFAETAIYPRVFDMGGYCEVIQALSEQYVRQKPAPWQLEPRVYVAFDRETIPGTLLRLEALVAPIRREGEVKLAGRILDNDGRSVLPLAEKTLKMHEFGRCEWLIPTAPLAVSPAVVPEITMTYTGEDGKMVSETKRLPHAMLYTPWIQNNSQVRMPLHALGTVTTKSFGVRQQGHLLEAEVEFASEAPVIRATLWRNDRIIGDFRPDADGLTVNFRFGVKQLSKHGYELRLKNGRFTGSVRRFGYGEDMNNPWLTADSQKINPRYQGEHACQAVFQDGGEFLLFRDGEAIGTLPAADLGGAGTVWFGDKDCALTCEDLNLASPINPSPFAGARKIRVLVNEQRSKDRFYVHYLLADGKSAFSQVVAPFCEDAKPRRMTLLNTYIYNQSRLDRLGYLDETALPEQMAAVADVNPLCVREGLWNFAIDGRDALGYRPIQTTAILPCLKPEGPDGSNCLVLDGTAEYAMHQRSYPIANCTIEFDLYVAAEHLKAASILTARTFYGSFDNIGISLLPDGGIEAVVSGGRAKLTLPAALQANAWNHVRLVFKETAATLSVNDRTTTVPTPLWRSHYNGCMTIGDKARGFVGKIDNLRFGGAWEEH